MPKCEGINQDGTPCNNDVAAMCGVHKGQPSRKKIGSKLIKWAWGVVGVFATISSAAGGFKLVYEYENPPLTRAMFEAARVVSTGSNATVVTPEFLNPTAPSVSEKLVTSDSVGVVVHRASRAPSH
jgi:hypothetical protein